ncbi:hypothetical protein Q31b_36900 [Novipirellula aureliae]|uniref:Uncharacterized protein n=1 Tax=Novipirellula aureliae TaxID=2527966 RepID=A0A5C6DY67_9BACT|nr:hypothetical protein Q31b_36900 [Novipirellula aureliae]
MGIATAMPPKKLPQLPFYPQILRKNLFFVGDRQGAFTMPPRQETGGVWMPGFPLVQPAYLITKFTNLPGTTICLTIVFPSTNDCTFSSAKAIDANSSFVTSGETLILALILPLI